VNSFNRYKILLRLKDYYNRLFFEVFIAIQPIYRMVYKSDIAYIYCRHPVITPFLINLKIYCGINIHFLKPGSDFSNYRRVIVPNGMWPDIKPTADQVASGKKIFCEVGFFPQNKNVYFDSKGVHGYSSVRDVKIQPLTQEQQHQLDAFKTYYTDRNYIKIRWDTIDHRVNRSEKASLTHTPPYLFVPLQIETDTAFDLCPFSSNQEMIEQIEKTLPGHKIIFKTHPWDENSSYQVAEQNILLPRTNTDLRELLLHADAVISCNSTVMLEALLYDKKCASIGVGFSTNHEVSLECHQDIEKLANIDEWEADPKKVDQFLYYLVRKQISVTFWKSEDEMEKLEYWLKLYEIFP
jgi:Capsule polysaccharide biosynthesis protein